MSRAHHSLTLTLCHTIPTTIKESNASKYYIQDKTSLVLIQVSFVSDKLNHHQSLSFRNLHYSFSFNNKSILRKFSSLLFVRLFTRPNIANGARSYTFI